MDEEVDDLTSGVAAGMLRLDPSLESLRVVAG